MFPGKIVGRFVKVYNCEYSIILCECVHAYMPMCVCVCYHSLYSFLLFLPPCDFLLHNLVVRIGFAQMMYSVMEEDASGNGNTVMVCVDLIGELDRKVTVVLTTMSGSATGDFFNMSGWQWT